MQFVYLLTCFPFLLYGGVISKTQSMEEMGLDVR
jgi:hypothetical protein